MYVYDIFGTFVLNYIVIILFGMVTTCSEVFKICALRHNDITVILNSCEPREKLKRYLLHVAFLNCFVFWLSRYKKGEGSLCYIVIALEETVHCYCIRRNRILLLH